MEYMNGDSPLFEAIFSAELRFNRAVIYPGQDSPRGKYPKTVRAAQDQSEWRLTVTALLQAA